MKNVTFNNMCFISKINLFNKSHNQTSFLFNFIIPALRNTIFCVHQRRHVYRNLIDLAMIIL